MGEGRGKGGGGGGRHLRMSQNDFQGFPQSADGYENLSNIKILQMAGRMDGQRDG